MSARTSARSLNSYSWVHTFRVSLASPDFTGQSSALDSPCISSSGDIDMPFFFDFLYFFVHDSGRNRRNTLLLLECCRLEVTEAGLKRACRLCIVGLCGF